MEHEAGSGADVAQAMGVTWGVLDFMSTTPTAEGYLVEAVDAGTTNFGNPEAQFEIVRSLLTDGSLAVLQGWDNREVLIRLKLSAPLATAGPALAAAERALMDQIRADSKAPLVYVPPASGSATCVFDVVAADLDRDNTDGWDFDETEYEYRCYLLTLTCLPFARPENPVSVAAIPLPPPTPTNVTVDDGTSLTPWSADAEGFGTVTRTNLATNPAPASTAGYTAGNSTLTMSAGWLRIWSPSGSSSNDTYASVGGDAGALRLGMQAGNTYTVSAERGASAVHSTNVSVRAERIVVFHRIGTATYTTVMSTPGLGRQSVTFTLPAGTTEAFVRLYNGSANPTLTGGDFYTDWRKVLVEQAGTAGTYFNGHTLTAGGTSYGWTGTPDASTSVAATIPVPYISSGAVTLSAAPHASGAERTVTLTRAGSVTMTSTPYLRVSLASTTVSMRFRIAGSAATPVAVTASAISGFTDYYFTTGDFDTVEVEGYLPSGTSTTAGSLRVAHIERTDTIAGAGSTARQQSRTAEVIGSAPTQAAIRLYDPTPAALGTEILVHSSRNTAWQPPLRTRMVSSATVTPDSAMVSGNRNTLTSAMTFRIPASMLTEGTYALMGRLSVTTAGTLTWTAKMVNAAGAATVGSSRVVTGNAALTVTSGYSLFTLGSVVLPVLAVEDDQMVELVLTGTANMTIDEAWLFGLDDGALTWVRDADSLSWIEIRSPELGAARPSVYGGTGVLGDNSSCIDWKCEAFGAHRFDPGLMQVFTLTTTSLVSQSTLEYPPRYFGHVEGEAA
jgi:hypothetical protein